MIHNYDCIQKYKNNEVLVIFVIQLKFSVFHFKNIKCNLNKHFSTTLASQRCVAIAASLLQRRISRDVGIAILRWHCSITVAALCLSPTLALQRCLAIAACSITVAASCLSATLASKHQYQSIYVNF